MSTPKVEVITAVAAAALPEVAAQHRVAMLVNAIDAVLAGNADQAACPVLQVALVDRTPLLHPPQN